MFEISGKHAVVTGAASGIGLAVCERFLKAGARVSAIDWRWQNTLTLDARRLTCDVSNEDALRGALADAAASGPIDILINNAGIAGPNGEISAVATPEVERTFAVNTLGVLYGLKHGPGHMMDGGAIINTASLAAFVAVGGMSAYAASKAAVVSLTRNAAVELAGRRIRCNVVCPGTVTTPMEPPGSREHVFAAQYSLARRAGTVTDLVGVYHFLASDEASYINGQAVVVDGGLLGFVTDTMAGDESG